VEIKKSLKVVKNKIKIFIIILLFLLFLYFLDDIITDISKVNIGKPGFCYINFEDNRITSSYICSQTKEVMDSFEIIKN
jgi:hypothetical protein